MTSGQFDRCTSAGTSRIIVYALYFLSTCSSVLRSASSATIGVKIEDDDRVLDWLDQKEDDLLPVQFNDVFAEKMIKFFKKLNSLRRSHQQDRLKSNNKQLFEPEQGRKSFAGKPVVENDYNIVQKSLPPPLLSENDDHITYRKDNANIL